MSKPNAALSNIRIAKTITPVRVTKKKTHVEFGLLVPELFDPGARVFIIDGGLHFGAIKKLIKHPREVRLEHNSLCVPYKLCGISKLTGEQDYTVDAHLLKSQPFGEDFEVDSMVISLRDL